jgi:hypothetical protein
MIERLLHEPGEGDGAGSMDRLSNEVRQSLIACEHGYLYVKSLNRYIVKRRRTDAIFFDLTI